MDTNLPISQLDPLFNNQFTGAGKAFEGWLGPMPTLQRTDPYEHRNVAVWEMPENYKGQNLTLRETVEELTFTANQTYLTKYILPWFPTDQVNLQWEAFEANAHLMDLTPYQTTSHALTQKRSVRRAQLVRHGIMGEFEADFLRTAMGRVSFLAALGQVAKSVIESVNQEAFRTLGSGHRYQQQFLRETGMPAEQLLKHYLEQDRIRFAIAQKTKNGLVKLDMLMTTEMMAYGADPDADYALLMPEPIATFISIARDEVTDYYIAGQQGPDIVNNNPRDKIRGKDGRMGGLDRLAPLHMVRNTPVFVVNNKKVSNFTDERSEYSEMDSRVRHQCHHF